MVRNPQPLLCNYSIHSAFELLSALSLFSLCINTLLCDLVSSEVDLSGSASFKPNCMIMSLYILHFSEGFYKFKED